MVPKDDAYTNMEVDEPVTEKKKAIQPSASAEGASKYPNMHLAQKIHRLTVTMDAEAKHAAGISETLSASVEAEIAGDDVENPSMYRALKETLGWSLLSDDDLTAMDAKHKKTLEELEAKVDEAKESAGDMEVLEARVEVARFAAKSLNKEAALEAYEKVLSLPKLSSGKTIDALMECARVASFHGDTAKTSELIERVSLIIDCLAMSRSVVAFLRDA
jgi:hypothetical protein